MSGNAGRPVAPGEMLVVAESGETKSRPATCQNRRLKLSTIKGALQLCENTEIAKMRRMIFLRPVKIDRALESSRRNSQSEEMILPIGLPPIYVFTRPRAEADTYALRAWAKSA
jgi:hypothetical protein